jgi:hypothetical protein
MGELAQDFICSVLVLTWSYSICLYIFYTINHIIANSYLSEDTFYEKEAVVAR